MTQLLTPARRRRGSEILDREGIDPATRTRSLRDVALANRLFGGTGAVLAELGPIFRARRGAELTLLDVGTGIADIPAAAAGLARRHGVRLTTLGIDVAEELARTSQHRTTAALCGDALALPFRDRSVDIVCASQVLHHFFDGDVPALVEEMHRVSRDVVLIAELRRSRLAAAGIWLASFPLRFHPVSRHDGVVSVFRGFTARELGDVVTRATGARPAVRHRPLFRVTALWHKEA